MKSTTVAKVFVRFIWWPWLHDMSHGFWDQFLYLFFTSFPKQWNCSLLSNEIHSIFLQLHFHAISMQCNGIVVQICGNLRGWQCNSISMQRPITVNYISITLLPRTPKELCVVVRFCFRLYLNNHWCTSRWYLSVLSGSGVSSQLAQVIWW